MKLISANEEQKRARDLVAYAEWGQRLSPEDYLAREQRLRAHAWSRETMRTWLLCTDEGAVLASCETFRMESLLRAADGSNARGTTYGVASVLTEQKLRGRGHATQMMSLLAERLRESDPQAHASILFSDVGPDLYARLGYVARPDDDLVLLPDAGNPAACVDALLDERDLPQALRDMPVPKGAFVLWPTAAQLDWHLERERIDAAFLALPRPGCCGARAGGATAVWAGSFKGERLAVLLLSDGRPNEIEALLLAARRTAGRAGMAKVHVWSSALPPGADETRLGRTRAPREGALPMILPLDARVRPESWRAVSRALWI